MHVPTGHSALSAALSSSGHALAFALAAAAATGLSSAPKPPADAENATDAATPEVATVATAVVASSVTPPHVPSR